MKEFFDSAEFSKAVADAVDLASYDIHDRWCQEFNDIGDPEWDGETREDALEEFIRQAEQLLATQLVNHHGVRKQSVSDNPEACLGCGCMPGDGRTKGCTHPDGCGYIYG